MKNLFLFRYLFIIFLLIGSSIAFIGEEEKIQEQNGSNVKEDKNYFPLTEKFVRESRKYDSGSLLIATTLTPLSVTIDLLTDSSKMSSGKVNREKMQLHAAIWNNPNSMIAKSRNVKGAE
jgi:hypothetical protein